MHVIAAKAVCFKEALEPGFKDYQAQVIRNAKAMAEVFIGRGYDVVSGGTDNHLMLISLVRQGLTGKAGCVGRITPWALSADVADKRRITASGYLPYGVGVLSGVSGVRRANNAMGVIRRCRG